MRTKAKKPNRTLSKKDVERVKLNRTTNLHEMIKADPELVRETFPELTPQLDVLQNAMNLVAEATDLAADKLTLLMDGLEAKLEPKVDLVLALRKFPEIFEMLGRLIAPANLEDRTMMIGGDELRLDFKEDTKEHEVVRFSVQEDGGLYVTHTRRPNANDKRRAKQKNIRGGPNARVQQKWSIPAEDSELLIGGLKKSIEANFQPYIDPDVEPSDLNDFVKLVSVNVAAHADLESYE